MSPGFRNEPGGPRAEKIVPGIISLAIPVSGFGEDRLRRNDGREDKNRVGCATRTDECAAHIAPYSSLMDPCFFGNDAGGVKTH